MKPALNVAVAAALAALVGWSAPALAHGGGAADEAQEALVALRQATLPLRDVAAAEAAGYAEFRDAAGHACIAQPGVGAMGVHYLNGTLIDAVVDPLQPEALVYAPQPNGTLQLAALEYIVFQEAWDALHPQPPTLFGHPFHLVRSPNRYNVPAFYELHVWLWQPNRLGLFADWNPAVHCP